MKSQDIEMDPEVVLRDIDMSLYEYEQEIIDDVNSQFESLR